MHKNNIFGKNSQSDAKKNYEKTTVPRKEFDRTPFGEHCYDEIKELTRCLRAPWLERKVCRLP